VKANDLHAWDLSPTEAVALQKRLRDRVTLAPLPDDVEIVAGADISYDRYSDVLHAGFVLVRLPTLEVVETAGVTLRVTFPYVPGLLSFRETPPLIEAWKRVTTRPDVVMLDGQGLAHPRRFGIACHVGLLFDVPAVGCAKTLLTGKFEPPEETAGSHTPLVHNGETVGAVVRTKDRVQPVYVSPGHLADVPSSVALALRCTSRYRVPEPTRLAHLFVNALRRGETWTPPKTQNRPR
jgi:deoxyribonuclease V